MDNRKLRIPLKVPGVVEVRNNGRLTIEYKDVAHTCTTTQALVWALIEDSSTIHQITVQLAMLTENDITQVKGLVDDAIAFFSQQGLTTTEQLPNPHLPKSTTAYSHFMTTRGGLFMFNRSECVRIDYGMFFGIIACKKRGLIVYEFPHKESSLFSKSFRTAKAKSTEEGRLRQYVCENGLIDSPKTLLSGLGNNVHHLVAAGEKLVLVDTNHKRVTEVDSKLRIKHYPVLDQSRDFHINSLAQWRNKWILLKSVGADGHSQSGFAVFDQNWNLEQEVDLPAKRAHDFWVVDDDEPAFWYCNSGFNEIKHFPSGNKIPVSVHKSFNNTTRGLAIDGDCWVTASGIFGRYDVARENSENFGSICFINRNTHQLEARLEVPETACCIVENPWYQTGST